MSAADPKATQRVLATRTFRLRICALVLVNLGLLIPVAAVLYAFLATPQFCARALLQVREHSLPHSHEQFQKLIQTHLKDCRVRGTPEAGTFWLESIDPSPKQAAQRVAVGLSRLQAAPGMNPDLRLTVLQPASMPVKPVNPNKPLLLLGGLLGGGWALALGWVCQRLAAVR